MWRIVRLIVVSERIINTTNNLYKNTKCCVTVDPKLKKWLAVLVGLRQGCLLPPALFNVFLEFVIQEIESTSGEFFLTDEKLITNVIYDDDTTLISLIFEKLQLTTNELHQACDK